jgi:tRNA threonylcarbamoyladenosine biosynthesis protein TsaB
VILAGSILAIDTTGDVGSIALIRDGLVLEERILDSPDGFAHVLFVEIERMMGRHAVGFDAIDLFAAASGPGSFTGVRVGLTAVKGLAEAAGRRVVAVSNLQALAAFGTRAVRAAVIDARRGEIYGAVYDSALELVCDEVVMKLDEWLAGLPADVELITRAIVVDGGVAVTGPLAGAVGRIAASRAGMGKDPAEIDANYVRRPDAELLWRD